MQRLPEAGSSADCDAGRNGAAQAAAWCATCQRAGLASSWYAAIVAPSAKGRRAVLETSAGSGQARPGGRRAGAGPPEKSPGLNTSGGSSSCMHLSRGVRQQLYCNDCSGRGRAGNRASRAPAPGFPSPLPRRCRCGVPAGPGAAPLSHKSDAAAAAAAGRAVQGARPAAGASSWTLHCSMHRAKSCPRASYYE